MTLTQTEWRDRLSEIEGRVEPYIQIREDGEKYIPAHPSLAKIASEYGDLIAIGMEHSWLPYGDEGEAA